MTDRLSAPRRSQRFCPLSDPGIGWAAVDAARLDLGLSKMDLAKIARWAVPRSPT